MAAINIIYTEELGRDIIMLDYNNKKYYFEKSSLALRQLQETFLEIPYARLDVKGKTVLDIGSNMGDTAIYFMANGASKVYGFDCDPEMVELARKNIKMNNLEDLIKIFEMKVTDLQQCMNVIQERERLALKLDCEGAELDIFKADVAMDREGPLKLFDNIIMEYHVEPYHIMTRLYQLGFLDMNRKSMEDSMGKLKYFGYIYSGNKIELE